MRRQQILDHVMPMSARVFVGAGSDEFGHGADPHKCVRARAWARGCQQWRQTRDTNILQSDEGGIIKSW